jgi:hypothetical protein
MRQSARVHTVHEKTLATLAPSDPDDRSPRRVYELDNAAADRAIDAGTTEATNGTIAIAAIKRRPR